jgi:hypothetical protein
MPMTDTLDLIKTGADVVSAIGILFVWWQITLHRKQVREDHERSRREISLQMMLEWAKKMERGTNVVTRFVDSLDEHQARRLAEEKPFTVGSDRLEYLVSLASATNLTEEQVFKNTSGQIELTQTCVSLVRAQAVNYLNMLEIVLTAWKDNIGDQEVLKNEFRPLYNPQRGDYMLEKFRQAVGGSSSFPSIIKFVQSIKNERETSTSKEKLGNV